MQLDHYLFIIKPLPYHPLQVQQSWQPQPDPQQQWPGWQAERQCFEPVGRVLPCMQAPKQPLPSQTAMQLEETGMQQLEASGSLPLSGQMTTLAHPGALLGQQQATFSCPQSPDRAVSLGNLPSLGSLPPLGSPLIAAAVPAAEVPVHVAHFAFCRVPPPPPRQQLGPQRQQQQQLRSTQPPSQESCAGSGHPMLGGPPTRDGATSQLPPRQPVSAASWHCV